MTRDEIENAIQHANTIVSAYGAVLERAGQSNIPYYRGSDLPYSKVQIRKAIELLLLLPNEEAKRNALEVGNVHLDYFVSDEEYGIVYQQRGGIGRAMTMLNAGEKDSRLLANTVLDMTTPEDEIALRRVQDRINNENRSTIERNRFLRGEAKRLAQP